MSKNQNFENSSCNKGLDLDDKTYLEIILELEKNMSNNYSIAMNEASSDDLYESFFDMFTCIKDTARDIYDYMKSLGWYTTEAVSQDKIDKKINELDEKLNCLEQ